MIDSSWQKKPRKILSIKTYRLFGLQSQPNTGPGCLYFLTNVPSTILTILNKWNYHIYEINTKEILRVFI